MIIWLDGPLGIGKTSVGLRICESLKANEYLLMDADEYFEKESLCGFNLESLLLPWSGGWFPYNNIDFLHKFREAIKKKQLEGLNPVVIMAMVDDMCKGILFDFLKDCGFEIVHIILTASNEEIEYRIKNDNTRADEDKKSAINMMNRIKNYLASSFPDDDKITTDGKSIDSIAKEVISHIPNLNSSALS